MYNARTDTLFEKPTFSKLAFQKKSCVVALDGYFEWKASPLAGGKGKKQPYFVHPTPSPNGNEEKLAGLDPGYLLMAGLWTSVPTGLSDEPYLDTFTILTTEACKQIEWLHHRMPVCLWDLELARKWLQDPSPSVHKAIDAAAKSYNEGFAWYMVTTDMSSVKFRGIEAIKEKKPPKPVTAFFSKMADTKSTPPKASSKSSQTNMTSISSPLKRQAEPLASYGGATPNKKVKKNTAVGSDSKGSITSFFQKKN
jgi:putative SOS response-associated peptidase YedK